MATIKVRQTIYFLLPLFCCCWIRDLGSGREKIRIRDIHPGSATLVISPKSIRVWSEYPKFCVVLRTMQAFCMLQYLRIRLASIHIHRHRHNSMPLHTLNWSFSTTKYIHIKSTTMCLCPLVGIGTLPPPLSPASVTVPLPPGTKGRGGTLACGWGVGGVPIPTTGEKA